MDAWVCQPEGYGGVPFAPWFPIDMEPLPRVIKEPVSKSIQPIVFSKFGERVAQAAGLDTRYVPHGVDTALYCPGDRAAARERTRLPADRFLVGMVAANKGGGHSMGPSRKAFCQQIEAFARFHRRHPDSHLHLHTHKGEGVAGCINLPEFIDYLGIAEAVSFTDGYQQMLGIPPSLLVDVYRSFDVLLNVSMGEGFGVPILEAQSCGVPVIVGDWTSMSELCWGGWMVDQEDSEPYWTPLAGYQRLPHIDAIDEALEAAYQSRDSNVIAEQARHGALPYDADKVTGRYWIPVLAGIESRIAAESVKPASLKSKNGAQTLNRAQRRELARMK